MKLRVVVALAVFATAAIAAEPGGRAEYIGGTVTGMAPKMDGRISTTDSEVMIFSSGRKEVAVPYQRINLLEYGQKVDRRYVSAALLSPMFLLSKSRKHFLTIGYSDPEGRQQALIFRVSKGDIRSVLVTLEARTGRKVQYQDDEARKAGKG